MNEQAAYLAETIQVIVSEAGLLLPEMLLAGFFLLLVTLDLFKSAKIKSLLPWLALTAFFASLIVQIQAGNNSEEAYFLELLVSDGIAHYAGMLFSAVGIFTVLLSVLNKSIDTLKKGQGEYYALVLMLVLGLNLMAKSVNLLMVFLAIEVVSIASYILTLTLKESKRSVEAGIKYILYGTLSAGVMLYGMSFFYGLTGTLTYADSNFWASMIQVSPMMVIVSAVLVLAGFFFKISAAPFHFWAPDVYQGAPLPAVALFSTGPKMAGIVVILRFVSAFADPVLAAYFKDVQLLLALGALATLAIGNFTALWQHSPRRLFAFSSISHAGFLLVGLLAFGVDYSASVLFYLTVLLFMNFGVFMVLQLAEDELNIHKLEDFSGIGRAYPFLGVMALLYLISLTGLPPLAGFMGKLFIFSNVWEAYTLHNNTVLLVLLITGILLTGVALFYYIKIPYYLFFKRNQSDINLVIPLSNKLLLVLFALPLLVLFFKPDLLLQYINQLLTKAL